MSAILCKAISQPTFSYQFKVVIYTLIRFAKTILTDRWNKTMSNCNLIIMRSIHKGLMIILGSNVGYSSWLLTIPISLLAIIAKPVLSYHVMGNSHERKHS